MQFPWELLRVNDKFLVAAQGRHMVREVPGSAGIAKRNAVINIVHVSFGADSALRFDEERCKLLETIPVSIPIEFLIDPSVQHLHAVMEGFRPHIVILSGHGHYDDLRGEHCISTTHDRYLRTAWLVALCESYGCKLLVLSTCESARLGGPVISDDTNLPADLVAFSFPVRTTTATQSLACLFNELVLGHTIHDSMAAVRAIDTEDEYAFFNAVHLHRKRARSLRLIDVSPPKPGPPATRCPGMELNLGLLNSFAHRNEPTTLLAPTGSGGEALIQHWAELVQRSQTQATRWRVLLDGAPILDVEGAQLVRLAYPHSFVAVNTENFVYCDGMDRKFVKAFLRARDQELARVVAEHPLLGMPSFVNDLIAGCTEQVAVDHFERENRMAERAGRLSREGSLFASWLFATEGRAATTFENRVEFAKEIEVFGLAAPVVVAGIENAVAATVVLARPEGLFLAPEFMILGERWFPNWRTDHRTAFQLLCAAFAKLDANDRFNEESASRLLEWAIRLEDWTNASSICISICRWYGEHGRLEEMKTTIERLLPHTSGIVRVTLRGHLITIATDHGNNRTGLAENRQLETDLQDLPQDDDYYINLYASITHQIDCLRELGRLGEAERRWRDAQALLPRLTEQRPEAEARLQGQLAHLRLDRGETHAALDAASQAVQLAEENHCSTVLIAELRYTKADLLRLVGRIRDAIEELHAITTTPMPTALRSRFLHLQALLLDTVEAPQALEYLLESYEQDRLRGDHAGVAISLLAIAEVFIKERDYDRARERIREALPLADACGLVNVVANLAYLWAQIDVAEGKTTSAATWLVTAQNKFAASDDEAGIVRVARLLDALRTRAE